MCLFRRRLVNGWMVLSLLMAGSPAGSELSDVCAEEPAAKTLQTASVKPDPDAWPNFRNGHQLRGLAGGALPAKLQVRWTRPITDGLVFTSAPAVVKGHVFVGTLGGELACLELKTGKTVWKYLSAPKLKPDTFIPGFPAAPTVSGDTVFLGDEDGVFHAVDRKTGKRRWAFQTMAEVNSSAVVLGNRVIFGSFDARLYCLDTRDGKKVWQFETADRINGSPAIAGKYTFVTGCDQHLRMINVETGAQEHDMPLGSFMIASPVIVDDMLYVGTHDGEFLAVNWKQHKVVWRYKDPQRNQPFHASAAIKGDRIVVGCQDKHVHCLDRKTGKRLWVFATRAQVNSSPVIAGDRVYFGSGDKHVYGVSLQTGKENWKFRGKLDFNAAPAVAGGCLLIGSEGTKAHLYCFGAKR